MPVGGDRALVRSESGQVQIRDYCPGDYGHIIQRYATLGVTEFSFLPNFECYLVRSMVALADLVNQQRARLLVAERDGQFLGSAAILLDESSQASIQFVLVEQAARGQGLGRILVKACIAIGRSLGVSAIVLDTASNLTAARQLYRSLGFVLVSQNQASFLPKTIVLEHWSLALS